MPTLRPIILTSNLPSKTCPTLPRPRRHRPRLHSSLSSRIRTVNSSFNSCSRLVCFSSISYNSLPSFNSSRPPPMDKRRPIPRIILLSSLQTLAAVACTNQRQAQHRLPPVHPPQVKKKAAATDPQAATEAVTRAAELQILLPLRNPLLHSSKTSSVSNRTTLSYRRFIRLRTMTLRLALLPRRH